jgi:hypothetical protein
MRMKVIHVSLSIVIPTWYITSNQVQGLVQSFVADALTKKQQSILGQFPADISVRWMGDGVDAQCIDCQVSVDQVYDILTL